MIDVRDLCIGNWVYDGERTQFPMFVQTIGDDYVYLNFEGNEGDVFESTPQELHGIPLTREQIEELGFVYIRDIEGIPLYKKTFKVSPDRNIVVTLTLRGGLGVVVRDEIKVDKSRYLIKEHVTIGCVFLHELQNFVFLTTKQPLKVSL